MEAPRQERQAEPLPANWPIALTGPVDPGQDKLQVLLTAVFLQEELSKRREAEEKLTAVQERLAALMQLQKDMADSAELDTAARFASFRALEVTPAISVAIAFAQNDKVICRAAAGSPAPAIGTVLDLQEGLLAECVRTGNVQLCYDTEADERVNVDACRALGVRSLVAVPITFSSAVLGLLAAFSSLPHAFNKDHVAVLETIAGILATRGSTQLRNAAATAQAGPARLTPEEAEVLLARSAPPTRNWTSTLVSYGAGAAVLLALAAVSLRGFIQRDGSRPSITRRGATSAGARDAARRDGDNSLAQQEQAERTVLPATAENTPSVSAARYATKSDTRPNIDVLRARAAHGDADAQFELGVKYAAGSEVRADDKEAARWLASAATQGNVQAERMLGDFYLLGRGVPKDLVKAYAWSAKAAAAGDETGKRRISVLKSVLTQQQTAAAEKLATQPNLSSSKR
jgi:putative methionine-R-sulfoxide reductase with GAF domain